MDATRLLALDLGERRIGVAVTDELRLTVRPLGTVVRVGPKRDARAVRGLLGETSAGLLVVGLPLLASGDEGASATAARATGDDLARRLELPVVYVDESDSTLEADRRLASAGVPPADRAARIDAEAAVIILETYLASLAEPAG